MVAQKSDCHHIFRLLPQNKNGAHSSNSRVSRGTNKLETNWEVGRGTLGKGQDRGKGQRGMNECG